MTDEDITMNTTTQEVSTLSDAITLLGEGKHTIATLAIKMDELIAKVNELSSKPQARGTKARDYGPTSTNAMTRLMAWRIMFGDLKADTARKISDAHGLSRGQVYSVKGGYTFRDVSDTDFSLDDVKAETEAEAETEEGS